MTKQEKTQRKAAFDQAAKLREAGKAVKVVCTTFLYTQPRRGLAVGRCYSVVEL